MLKMSSRSRKTARFRWIASGLHTMMFAITWIIALVQPQPLLDGPARWGFAVLTIADFPISVIAFSMLWDKGLLLGLSVWATIGTLEWFFLGMWLERRFAAASR